MEGVDVWEYKLKLWCFNSGIIFNKLATSRSVLLLSGTLSPLSSFSIELQSPFPFQLEAEHVVPTQNVFFFPFLCKYTNTNSRGRKRHGLNASAGPTRTKAQAKRALRSF